MTEAMGLAMPSLRPGSRPAARAAHRLSDEVGPRHLRRASSASSTTTERELPRDGKRSGTCASRRPWIASGYFKGDGERARRRRLSQDRRHRRIDPHGHVTLTDRSKDVIKSGGEWISSIQLEDAAASHPDVLQAAVIAVPHPKWQERPLLLVVRRRAARLDGAALMAHPAPKVAKLVAAGRRRVPRRSCR